MALIPVIGANSPPDTYQWIVAWVLVVVLAALATKTQTGYKLIYYALALMLVFLLITQYQFIANGLAPVGQPVPTGTGA